MPTHKQIMKFYQEKKNRQTSGNFQTAIFSYNDHLKMPDAPYQEEITSGNKQANRIQQLTDKLK